MLPDIASAPLTICRVPTYFVSCRSSVRRCSGARCTIGCGAVFAASRSSSSSVSRSSRSFALLLERLLVPLAAEAVAVLGEF